MTDHTSTLKPGHIDIALSDLATIEAMLGSDNASTNRVRSVLTMTQAALQARDQQTPSAFLLAGGRTFQDAVSLDLASAEKRQQDRNDGSQIHALFKGQLPVGLVQEISNLLTRAREFIDSTQAPPYPAGAGLADEIEVGITRLQQLQGIVHGSSHLV